MTVLQRITALWLAALMLAALSTPAAAVDAVAINPTQPAIDISRAVQFISGVGDMVEVPTAAGPDGIVRKIEVRAREGNTNPVWMIFALTNNTDEQVDRLVVIPHYRFLRSGFYWPDLGSQRMVALTPSQGFRPERQNAVDQDVYLITLDPGTTVTYVAELKTMRVPQVMLWRPEAFKDRENSFTLYRGIVIGIAGLLALFLSIAFVLKGAFIFPAAALLAWSVLGLVGLEFGFWTRVFNLAPEGVRFYRAVGEAVLSATMVVFLFAYLNLARWHVRYTQLTVVWLAFVAGLVSVAVFDPAMAAGIARMSLVMVAISGLLIIFLLIFEGYDRAILIAPTWIIFVGWVFATSLAIMGRVSNEIVTPALLGGLVLIVMLIGFTVMQQLFSGSSLGQVALSGSERKALALAGAGDIVWDWNVSDEQVHLGLELDPLIGLRRTVPDMDAAKFIELAHPADRDILRSSLDALVDQRRGRLFQEFRVRAQDGHFLWFMLKARPVIGSDGAVARCVGTITDITDHKATEERLLHDSVHDNLSGLPNRELFIDRVESSLTFARLNPAMRPTVMVIDMDRFRDVNETAGIAVGDSILLTLSRRLGRLLRPEDTLARIGGDKFGIILMSEVEPERISAFADTIRKTVKAPIAFGEREIFLTASIGLALADVQSQKQNESVKDAELAVYFAKRAGGDRIEVFKPAMRSQRTDRLTLESNLRRAIERDEIKVEYQPIVRLADRTISGFEALMRWDHPTLGRIPPSEFIGVAEDSNLIIELGLHVMDRAARQLSAWQQKVQTNPPIFVSVNVSSRQILRHDLLQDVKGVLSRIPLAPWSLKLELTESLVMDNPEYAAQMLQRIKDLGAGLSLDDFGTGYSSLAYLQRFPFDTIKIDRSLVQADQRGNRPVLLRSIVAMAHDLNMQVVAEGAENEADTIELYQLGCDYGQGYAFGHPVSAEEATRLLMSYAS